MKRKWTQSENAALARLFSSSVIRELAKNGNSPLVGRLLYESGLTSAIDNVTTYRDLFDWAYIILQTKENRHEYIYKNAIAQKVLLGKHSLNSSCMLTEFRAGACKADVVILNGKSTVYEIKSERDRLDRLEQQLTEYLKIFDLVQVITGENHLLALEKTIPSHVGIQLLSQRYTISEHRPAISNRANVAPESIFESLNRVEYLAILRKYGFVVSDVPNTRIHTVAKELFVSLTPEQAHDGMVEVLKQTRCTTNLRSFIGAIPNSLKAVAVSIPLNNHERMRFLDTLETRLDNILN